MLCSLSSGSSGWSFSGGKPPSHVAKGEMALNGVNGWSVAQTYLGAGVYVGQNADGLVLTADDGRYETNRIVLEPAVYRALVEYVERRCTGNPRDARRMA